MSLIKLVAMLFFFFFFANSDEYNNDMPSNYSFGELIKMGGISQSKPYFFLVLGLPKT